MYVPMHAMNTPLLCTYFVFRHANFPWLCEIHCMCYPWVLKSQFFGAIQVLRDVCVTR